MPDEQQPAAQMESVHSLLLQNEEGKASCGAQADDKFTEERFNEVAAAIAALNQRFSNFYRQFKQLDYKVKRH